MGFMEFMGSIVGGTFRSPNLEQRDVTFWQWIPILGHQQDVGLGQVETLKKAAKERALRHRSMVFQVQTGTGTPAAVAPIAMHVEQGQNVSCEGHA